MKELEGKIALVTGSSRGIGRAIIEELAKAGAKVIGTATSVEGASFLEKQLNDKFDSGKSIIWQASDDMNISSFMEKIFECYNDYPDIVVNNAGSTCDRLFIRMELSDLDQMLLQHLRWPFLITKECLRQMMKKRWGRVVQISSVVAITGNPGQANYAAAKAGMIAFSKSMASEVASRGITINMVLPGLTSTDMTASLNQEALLSRIPAKRAGNVEEVASLVRFLSSPQASYINGQAINVDGGMLMV